MSNTIKIKRRVSGSGNLGALAVGELGVNIDDNNKLYVGTSAGNKLTALPTSGGTLTGTLNAVGIIASSSVTAVGLTTSSGFTLTGGDAYFQGSGGVNFNGGPVSFSATAHISSTVKFAAGSSGTLAKRTGYDDFIGYNASYGSYIGGGAGNAARYLAAGGSFYDGSTWRTLYHTGNLPQYLPLAGGTLSGDLTVAGSCTFAAISGTTATFSGTITGHGSIDLQDNDKLLLGAGNDLEIYHDGSNSYIKNKIGWLNVPLSQNGMTLANSDFSEIVAKFMINNACELYYNGSKKFETTATGVSVSSSGNGKLGINTASPAKSLTVVYNTSTTLNTGESLAGAGSALGVLINNTNTTTNSFAGLDFRANDSDARLLWRHTASNRGQFEFVGDQNGSFNSHLIIKDTGYAEFSGNNDVRLTLGSTGTGGSNSAVFIRGNGTTLSFNSPGGNIVWENSGSEKMRLNASGNFGIGGQDPAMTLDVYRSVTGNWLSRIHNIATSGNSSGLLVRMDETGSSGMALGVNVNGSYKLVLKPNGNVGIGGTTAPAQTLHIAANGSGSTAVDNHGYGLRVQDTNSAHGAIDILQNGDTATFVSRSNVQGGYEFKSYASVGTATHVRLKIASNGDISFLDGAGSATFLWSRANGRLVLSKSDYQLQIQNGANIWFNKVNSSGSFAIHRNGVGDILSMGTGGTDINAHTHFRPYNNNQYTCGTNANRWSNVYSVAGNFSGSVAIAQGQLLYLDGGSNTYMYSDTADSIAIATGGSVRMTLNNSGVGINAAPDGGLKIKSTGDGVNVLNLVDSAGDAMFNIRQSSNDCLIRAYKDGGTQKVQIHTDGSSWFTGGQVGIGTSAPFTEGLEVAFPSADTSFNLNDQSDSILVLRNSDSGSTNTGRFCAIQMKINSSSAAAEGTIRTEFAGDGDADLIFSTTKGGTGYDRMTLDEDGYLTIGAITLPKTDGSANQVLKTNGSGTLSWTDQSGGGGSGVTGSGTTHYVPKFTASGAIGNSTIQQASSGNFTGFGLSPSYSVHVLGIIAAQDAVATARLIATGAGGTMIDLKSDGGIFKIRNASAGNELYHLKTGNSGYHKWYIADSLKMTLHASGTLAVTGSITSDGKSVPKKYSSYIAVNTATTDYYTLQHNLGTDMIIVQARNGFDSNSASSLQNRFTQSGNNGKSFDLGSESVEFVCIPCDSNGTKSNNHVSFDFGGLGSFNGYIYVTVIG